MKKTTSHLLSFSLLLSLATTVYADERTFTLLVNVTGEQGQLKSGVSKAENLNEFRGLLNMPKTFPYGKTTRVPLTFDCTAGQTNGSVFITLYDEEERFNCLLAVQELCAYIPAEGLSPNTKVDTHTSFTTSSCFNNTSREVPNKRLGVTIDAKAAHFTIDTADDAN